MSNANSDSDFVRIEICNPKFGRLTHHNRTHSDANNTMPLIPYVIEKSGREERAMDIYSRLLNDRIVMLGSA